MFFRITGMKIDKQMRSPFEDMKQVAFMPPHQKIRGPMMDIRQDVKSRLVAR